MSKFIALLEMFYVGNQRATKSIGQGESSLYNPRLARKVHSSFMNQQFSLKSHLKVFVKGRRIFSLN